MPDNIKKLNSTETLSKVITTKQTPLMAQYNKIKTQYPDAILLFRVGDFYETFNSDAVKASEVLGIVLTKRGNGTASEMDLAGFPHHAVDTYLPKLVKAGYRVAICEQLEDPKMTKTIVKRGVTELVTPGVTINDKILEHHSNNFLCSIYFEKNEIGIAFIDISTGEFLTAYGSIAYIDKLLQNFSPSEIIFPKNQQKLFKDTFGQKYYTYALDEWMYQDKFLEEKLLQHFGVQTLRGYGFEVEQPNIKASGAAIYYLQTTTQNSLEHIKNISRIDPDKYVWLDRFTVRNLELIHPQHPQGVALIHILDKTLSPMGARMLKRWLQLPLKEKAAIEQRQDMIAYFILHPNIFEDLVYNIQQIGDIERWVSKIPVGKANPRDIVQLKNSLLHLPAIKKICLDAEQKSLKSFGERIQILNTLTDLIENRVENEAPVAVQKGNTIKRGFHLELDELRLLSSTGKNYIAEMQSKESEITGIPSLKIGFNNVFGYYLEVRNTHKDKVPESWIRKQTISGAERYITPELKIYEEKILGAEEKIQALEIQLYEELLNEIKIYIEPILQNAQLIAAMDCIQSFVKIALKNNYHRPQINNDTIIQIKNGRHPVIEQKLPLGEPYIPNDTYLDNDSQQIMIITGPNMAGKSALLRQVALITLMAQIGSFVPADQAKIGLVDKIFTRVGASDNLSMGESTFMVEMIETAGIVNNLSDRSLVLLDEIGRGTSTYDGISIAWSLVEYIHNHPTARAKTMFATHYHELSDLEDRLERVKNFNVTVQESNKKMIFLRKLQEGSSQHSFGIQVAKMAGLPEKMIKRANEILAQLEAQKHNNNVKDSLKSMPKVDYQLNLFAAADPRLIKLQEILENLDINTLTPVEALIKLNELKSSF
jgi:DNA mismatch repair protein MutS